MEEDFLLDDEFYEIFEDINFMISLDSGDDLEMRILFMRVVFLVELNF